MKRSDGTEQVTWTHLFLIVVAPSLAIIAKNFDHTVLRVACVTGLVVGGLAAWKYRPK